MPIINYEELTPWQLIVEFINEKRGDKLCWNYREYEFVNQWLMLLPDTDQLLLILDDLLQKEAARKKSVSTLRPFHRRVLKRIRLVVEAQSTR